MSDRCRTVSQKRNRPVQPSITNGDQDRGRKQTHQPKKYGTLRHVADRPDDLKKQSGFNAN
jgi:hypothetical protein